MCTIPPLAALYPTKSVQHLSQYTQSPFASAMLHCLLTFTAFALQHQEGDWWLTGKSKFNYSAQAYSQLLLCQHLRVKWCNLMVLNLQLLCAGLHWLHWHFCGSHSSQGRLKSAHFIIALHFPIWNFGRVATASCLDKKEKTTLRC